MRSDRTIRRLLILWHVTRLALVGAVAYFVVAQHAWLLGGALIVIGAMTAADVAILRDKAEEARRSWDEWDQEDEEDT